LSASVEISTRYTTADVVLEIGSGTSGKTQCSQLMSCSALITISELHELAIPSDVDRGQTPEDEDEDKITRPRTRLRTIFFLV